MKSLVVSFVLAVLLVLSGITSAESRNADESLALFMPLDEGSGGKVKDFSMYGNDGALKGLGGKPVWGEGRYGAALEFTIGGQNSWVEVPHSDSLNITGEITMMAWVLNRGQTTWGRVVDKNHPYLLYMGADDSIGGYALGIVDFHTARIPVTRDEWMHVAGVLDGSELRLYVNSELAETTAAAGDIPQGSNPLTIGDAMGDQWLHTRPFVGLIDEVKIYNKVLTDDEIAEAMEPTELAVQPSVKLPVCWSQIKRL
jgi:hypothetical protein